MADAPKKRSLLAKVRKAVVEIAFIVFLFYSNLLMGDFTRTRRLKSFAAAFRDIVTPANFGIAVFSAVVGYIVFEYLRKKS
jgi:hypothetical protein